MDKLKKYVGYLFIFSLTYNVVIQPLLNSSFGLNLPKLNVDDQLLKTMAGVFSLVGL
ncbi:hypothetical protein [Providencia sp. JUb39]|uniref:hypothetical protein n=1 Tax=Providencia sp. JUb39 TaxID=2724165 RepID=UPI00164D7952|nr:hypothetical protein [Providencia sp. JUb39]MBC5790600.1 hypothetical protein [Providencia sp. JUb39]